MVFSLPFYCLCLTGLTLVSSDVIEGPFLQIDGQLLETGQATVRDNMLMTVNCVVRGASSAIRSFSWFLDGANVTNFSQLLMEYSAEENTYESQSVLKINVTKENHRKALVCQAQHSSWLKPVSVRTNLNVQYEPDFSLIRDPVFGYPVIVGMSISLRCIIDANPPSQPQWIRDHSMTPGSSKLSQEILFTAPDGSLNIASVSFTDTGWYRCTTNHTLGYFTSFSYFLNVKNRAFLKEWSAVMCASKGSLDSVAAGPDDRGDSPDSTNLNDHRPGAGLGDPGTNPITRPRWSSRHPSRPLPTADWTFRKPLRDNNRGEANSMAKSSNNQNGSVNLTRLPIRIVILSLSISLLV